MRHFYSGANVFSCVESGFCRVVISDIVIICVFNTADFFAMACALNTEYCIFAIGYVGGVIYFVTS